MSIITTNTAHVRRINLEVVKTALKTYPDGLTKAQLAEHTGLSIASCNNLLKELMVSSEVLTAGQAQPDSGRPSFIYIYNPAFSAILSIYLSVSYQQTTLHYEVTNALGEQIEKNDMNVPQDKIVEYLLNLIAQQADRYTQLSALGVGIPGVSFNNQIISCDITELANIDLEKQIKAVIDLPLLIENDMNLVALGHLHRINPDTKAPFVYLYFPEGHPPGSGLVINGDIVQGASQFAGEIASTSLFSQYGNDFSDLEANVKQTILAELIQLFTAIINPERLIFSGSSITAQDIVSAVKLIKEPAILQHLPSTHYEENLDLDYFTGLRILTQRQLGFQYKLIDKKN